MPARNWRQSPDPWPAVCPTGTPRSHPDPEIVPIAFVAKPDARRVSHAKRDKRSSIAGRGLVDNAGIVFGHIDGIRLGRHYPDVVALHFNLLLRRIDKGPGRARLDAELLNGLHDVGRLLRKRRP